MDETENIVGFYYDRLTKESPGPVLVDFYRSTFELPYDKTLYGTMSRLVKLFGREAVFYSILDLAGKELDHTNIFGLLRYICTRKLEEKLSKASYVDLSAFVKAQNKLIDKAKGA
jgi:hypothetical protein